MTMCSAGLLVVLMTAIPLSISFLISPELTKCDLKSVNLNGCLVNNFNRLIPRLMTGWPWSDVTGLSPLMLSPTIQTGYHDGNITLDLILKNTCISGLLKTNATVVKSRAIEEGKLEVMTHTPKIAATGQYSSEGVMASFPLHSEGDYNITLVDVNLAWVIYLVSIPLNKATYVQVDHLGIDAMPLQIVIRASQFMDGSNSLGDSLNLYLNNNSFELYNLIKPRLMKFFSDIFKEVINELLLSAPMSEMLPGLHIQK